MKTAYTLVSENISPDMQFDTIQQAMQAIKDDKVWDLELGEVIEVWQLVKKFRIKSTLEEIE